jgi:hypothetical protein
MVLIEVPLNAYVLWVIAGAARRLAPFAADRDRSPARDRLGTLIVAQVSPARCASSHSSCCSLSCCRRQAHRRPIRSERSVGFGFGGALGVLRRHDHFRSALGGDAE